MEQAEVFTIISTSQNILTFEGEVRYTHYGEIYKTIDMRAEIGLLTRYVEYYISTCTKY